MFLTKVTYLKKKKSPRQGCTTQNLRVGMHNQAHDQPSPQNAYQP